MVPRRRASGHPKSPAMVCPPPLNSSSEQQSLILVTVDSLGTLAQNRATPAPPTQMRMMGMMLRDYDADVLLACWYSEFDYR